MKDLTNNTDELFNKAKKRNSEVEYALSNVNAVLASAPTITADTKNNFSSKPKSTNQLNPFKNLKTTIMTTAAVISAGILISVLINSNADTPNTPPEKVIIVTEAAKDSITKIEEEVIEVSTPEEVQEVVIKEVELVNKVPEVKEVIKPKPQSTDNTNLTASVSEPEIVKPIINKNPIEIVVENKEEEEEEEEEEVSDIANTPKENPLPVLKKPTTNTSTIDTLKILGIYGKKNLYVLNPYASDADIKKEDKDKLYAVQKVIVNNIVTSDNLNESAFEIDFSNIELGLKKGSSVSILIIHLNGRNPKVLNLGVIQEK
ncbi:MAG: hypothetical protein HRT71_16130 [Flavobacteriales bacterium]|nr:hypothetical protein [Flavobacteriales bacterium]